MCVCVCVCVCVDRAHLFLSTARASISSKKIMAGAAARARLNTCGSIAEGQDERMHTKAHLGRGDGPLPP